MQGRLILTASGLVLFVLGLAGLFAPDEIAARTSAGDAGAAAIQIAAAGFIGFGVVDWLSRNNRIGGIYARPLGLANLFLFACSALSTGKAAAAGALPAIAWGLCAVFAVLGLAFAWLVFAHDPLRDA